ncbi:putative metallo-beta-lactamase domain protein [Lepidopterella palustris CBS 459.81]|uniref:Putative metallo-beta-lactamase domain protein n=1 Tax=Lepidopterella palustris CBS 459.81 TaxID=1314670 RepID=A0A8E2JA22_9PEZI|nr:putative metallo-beta-lactamase domain protein [Lepidopterella palustris CBS 459.81]
MADAAQSDIHTIFEPNTSTWQYIVADAVTKDAVIIDSVLDYDIATSTITTSSADNLLDIVKRHNYKIIFILETHAHADHLTASKYIQQTLLRAGNPKPQICIGKRIEEVQHTFATKYRIDEAEYVGVFDKLLDHGERLSLGSLEIEVLHLPGHTPDHVGYVIGSNVFTGDSLFLPDVGSARCDFPGGDATALFKSMSKLLSLPPDFRLYSGHDYPPNQGEGRKEPRAFATVAEQRAKNKHVHDGVSMDEFVQWRTQRDATLGEPRLLHQALQFNIRAGQLPTASEHGHRFFHVPLKVPEDAWTWGVETQG